MTWAVVIFPAENAVEVVPISWFVNESKECFWPPKNIKKSIIVRHIQNCEEPDIDWVAHPAKLLGQYDSLDMARKKARRAEEQSDISSSDVGRGVRKSKPNLKYVNTSDEEMESSGNDDEFPTFTPHTAFESICMTSNKSNLSLKNKKVIHTGDSNDLNNLKKNRHDDCEPASETVSTDAYSLSTNNRQTKNNEDVTETGTNSNPSQCTKQKDVQKVVMEEILLIHMKLDLILERLKMNERSINNVPLEYNKKGIEEFFSKIPVNSEDSLNDLEEWLSVNENYKIAVSQLNRIGGLTMAQATRKTLYRTIGNEVAELFSWDGAKKKRPFKNLYIAKVLLDSIKITFVDTKEDQIIAIIKVWLVKAKERMKMKRPQNEEQTNQELND